MRLLRALKWFAVGVVAGAQGYRWALEYVLSGWKEARGAERS